MYKETLRAMAGIGLFPAVSLILFVVVFASVLIGVFRMKRTDVEHLAALALDPGDAAVPAGKGAGR